MVKQMENTVQSEYGDQRVTVYKGELAMTLEWLETALGCKSWHWDPDQKEAAQCMIDTMKCYLNNEVIPKIRQYNIIDYGDIDFSVKKACGKCINCKDTNGHKPCVELVKKYEKYATMFPPREE